MIPEAMPPPEAKRVYDDAGGLWPMRPPMEMINYVFRNPVLGLYRKSHRTVGRARSHRRFKKLGNYPPGAANLSRG